MSREWTEDELEILKTMWDDGASASQVARKLPADRTRSAVLGRVHRMRLTKRTIVASIPKKQLRACGPNLVVVAAAKAKLPAEVVVTDDPGPMDPPITALEIKDGYCRWPYDVAGGYHYCGQPPKASSPWCPYHHRKAHQPKASAA